MNSFLIITSALSALTGTASVVDQFHQHEELNRMMRMQQQQMAWERQQQLELQRQRQQDTEKFLDGQLRQQEEEQARHRGGVYWR